MKYSKTKSGYYYKQYKNGKKVRISKETYYKKLQKGGIITNVVPKVKKKRRSPRDLLLFERITWNFAPDWLLYNKIKGSAESPWPIGTRLECRQDTCFKETHHNVFQDWSKEFEMEPNVLTVIKICKDKKHISYRVKDSKNKEYEFLHNQLQLYRANKKTYLTMMTDTDIKNLVGNIENRFLVFGHGAEKFQMENPIDLDQFMNEAVSKELTPFDRIFEKHVINMTNRYRKSVLGKKEDLGSKETFIITLWLRINLKVKMPIYLRNWFYDNNTYFKTERMKDKYNNKLKDYDLPKFPFANKDYHYNAFPHEIGTRDIPTIKDLYQISFQSYPQYKNTHEDSKITLNFYNPLYHHNCVNLLDMVELYISKFPGNAQPEPSAPPPPELEPSAPPLPCAQPTSFESQKIEEIYNEVKSVIDAFEWIETNTDVRWVKSINDQLNTHIIQINKNLEKVSLELRQRYDKVLRDIPLHKDQKVLILCEPGCILYGRENSDPSDDNFDLGEFLVKYKNTFCVFEDRVPNLLAFFNDPEMPHIGLWNVSNDKRERVGYENNEIGISIGEIITNIKDKLVNEDDPFICVLRICRAPNIQPMSEDELKIVNQKPRAPKFEPEPSAPPPPEPEPSAPPPPEPEIGGKKTIRKHRGIHQTGGHAGKLKKGYKYTGKRLKNGKPEIKKVK